MATSYRDYHPNQAMLLPEDLRDWLPRGHLAWRVSEMVDALDLRAFHAPYAKGDGRRKQPYDPRMMVKVLVYAYATGVFSSRRIAARLEQDVAFRVLGAGNFPAHRTICEFRRRHLADFGELFVAVVVLARELGHVKFGKLSVDGTKVRANASRGRSRTHEKLGKVEARLRAEVGGLLERARRVDESEDAEYGEGVRGDECPESLRDAGARRRALAEARKRLEEERAALAGGEGDGEGEGGEGGAESEVRTLERLDAVVDARENVERDHAARAEAARERGVRGPRKRQQGNTTDADSRIMKTPNEGYQQCYNAQLGVDGAKQIIVSAEVGNNAGDHGVLPGMLEGLKTTHGEVPGTVLADGGYCNEHDLADLEERKIRGYVHIGKDKVERARADPVKLPATLRMAGRMETDSGKSAYGERCWLSEAPNGWIKRGLGFRQFSVRGLEAVRGEWNLVCLALNMRRMHGMGAAAAVGG